MARNYYNLSVFFVIIIFESISKSHPQSNFPSANLLCISECDTCSATCSPPPPNPKLPPLLPMPPQYSPPAQPYYYFTSPAPSSPPPPRSKPPPPPLVNVYNPGGNTVPARNFSYPYYYFYAANAASGISVTYFHGSCYILIMLVFFTVFV